MTNRHLISLVSLISLAAVVTAIQGRYQDTDEHE